MNCRVCNSLRIQFLCDIETEILSKSLQSFRCVDCGSMFIGNDISNEQLEDAYENIDTDSYYDEVGETTNKKMDLVVNNINPYISSSTKILDIGSGDGRLLKKFNQDGFDNLYAHEIPGSGIKQKVGKITKGIYQDIDYSTIPSNEFDLVTHIDVLEHVTNPRNLIKACSRIVKPGGFIYFHTPVVSRIDQVMQSVHKIPAMSRIAKAWQQSRTSIYHLSIFSPKSIISLMNEVGLEVEKNTTINELSWPLSRYIQNYLISRYNLPKLTEAILYPLMWIFLGNKIFNSNKGIFMAKKSK